MVRSKQSQAWGAASKLNRDPAFLDGLIEHGKARAGPVRHRAGLRERLARWGSRPMVGFFADDAEISSTAPFAERPSRRGMDVVRGVIDDWLAAGLRVDPTRKQIAGDTVTWRVRSSRRTPASARSVPRRPDSSTAGSSASGWGRCAERASRSARVPRFGAVGATRHHGLMQLARLAATSTDIAGTRSAAGQAALHRDHDRRGRPRRDRAGGDLPVRQPAATPHRRRLGLADTPSRSPPRNRR